jgi:hypothetical protein
LEIPEVDRMEEIPLLHGLINPRSPLSVTGAAFGSEKVDKTSSNTIVISFPVLLCILSA